MGVVRVSAGGPNVMQMDPMSGAMFVFINARRNKLKLRV
jgi:hypothetical protein